MATDTPTEPLGIDVADRVPEAIRRGPATLIVPSTDPVFDQVAEVEARIFPEAPRLFGNDAEGTLFHFKVLVVDDSVRHVLRLSGPGPLSGLSGAVPFFVTDLVEGGQELSLQELDTYYALVGARLERMISVETNFRLGPHLEPIRSADLAYLSLFALAERTGADAVLAHLNPPAITSLERVGVQWHRLAGRTDLRTPTIAEDGTTEFDPDYFPICILGGDPINEQLVSDLAALTPEIHFLGREEVVADLRDSAGLGSGDASVDARQDAVE